MPIKARLRGVTADLEVMADLFAEGDVRVSRDDEGYYLTAPEIDNPPPGAKFYEAAQDCLLKLNGLARLDDPSFRPVVFTGTFEDGERTHQVIWAEGITATARFGRAKVTQTNPDGTLVPPPPSPWPHRVRVSDMANPAVDRVLRIMARNDDLDWYDLYKIHEIIRHDIRPRKLDELGWTSKAQDRAFTASADRFDVSGDAARHAVDRHEEPPKRTMTIGQGRAYISNLVKVWLDSLTA